MEDLQKKMQEAIQNISMNHRKIIDDFCKAYMAQRYEEGKSIKPGSFVLNEQDLPIEEKRFGKRYWFTEGIPDYSEQDINLLEVKMFEIFERWGLDAMHCSHDNKIIISEIIELFKTQ
jgi:hypothetical protein